MAEGFTGGAAWRSQALRVVRAVPASSGSASAVAVHSAGLTTFSPDLDSPLPDAPTLEAPTLEAPVEPGRAYLRPELSFAQHGLLGAPDALIVRVGVESVGSGAFDIEVAFTISDDRSSLDCAATAGWFEESPGWTYMVRCQDGRAIVVLSHAGYLQPGDVAEATFRMTLGRRVNLNQGLLLRTSARTPDADGAHAHDLAIPVERLGL